jgi:hypothetical protein
LTFPRLEGIYRQSGRAFVVTYQGWWLDLTPQQVRQLIPAGGGTFTYGPGWRIRRLCKASFIPSASTAAIRTQTDIHETNRTPMW